MVQSIQSAKYAGMPQNAIATGVADYILSPAEMPQKLIQYAKGIQKNQFSTEINKEFNHTHTQKFLYKILVLIRNQTGHDFSLYKKNTIFRRIERRMHVHQLKNIENYLNFIQENEQEISILFNELLIGVTSFFRDKEAFDNLKNSILPQLLLDKPDNYTFRVWIPGCSSGEEAYSIAIILQECLTKIKINISIQIFATDIDELAIERARRGIYPMSSILADVSATYTKRYFIKEDDNYHIKKSIRENLVFATQNLIKDPPFTKLDLICCRNLLIYFDSELQKKVLPMFHYSLKQDGVLFLGSSETTGQSNHYFKILDKKWKLFKRKPKSANTCSGITFSEPMPPSTIRDTPMPETIAQIEESSALQLVESILKQSKVEPCAIIDKQHNIIYVHGHLGQFLEPPEGRASNQILDMARTITLKNELINGIRNVSLHKKELLRKAIAIHDKGTNIVIDLTFRPLQDLGSLKNLIMVIFKETPLKTADSNNKTSAAKSSTVDNSTLQLQQELDSTREHLQTTIEELETSNEELKSSNEELQSTNEELQSTNEELETSKEELQSLNEESVTVNSELQSRIDELSTTNDDIKNLLDSTQLATIFLNTELKIRRYTPKMTDIMNLVISDIDRPISDLSTRLYQIELKDYASKVLSTLDKIEIEVRSNNHQYYKMRVLPYRTINNVIDGVLISFEDTSKFKDIEIALRASELRYKALFEHSPMAILEVDVTELLHYQQQHKLTSIDKLDAHWKKLSSIKRKQTFSAINLLNINHSGMTMLKGNNVEAINNDWNKIMDMDDYLYQQLRTIIEEKGSQTFRSNIHTLKNEKLPVEIIITIPKIIDQYNYANSILVISLKE